MKKALVILLVFSLTIPFCGCFSQPYDTLPPETTTQESTQIPPAPAQIKQLPMYSVTLTNVEETEKADDGTVLLTSKHQNISLTLPEQEVADKIILDFLDRVDRVLHYSETMLDSAKSAYVNATKWEPFLLDSHYSAARIDSSVLSLYGTKISYIGGAHADRSGQAVTYDLISGKALQMTDILQHNVTKDTLLELVQKSLESSNHNKSLFPSYKDTLTQLFSADLSKLNHWYLTPDSLNFFFDPYEIAPYTEGIVTAQIPYEQLIGILKDAYFPAEIDQPGGSIQGVLFENAALEHYTQISEVILEEGAQKILLYADGAVFDISLCAGAKGTISANVVENDDEIFAAYSLTPGDAIMVEADFENTTLLIGYRTGDGYRMSSVTIENGSLIVK